MNANVGGLDRILRVLVGLALIGAAVTGYLGAWAYIGIVPLVTAAVGFCPAYKLIGLNTCSMRSST
jgi:hypothetical protein